MGGKKGSSDSENTVRYAEYLENAHERYINDAFALVSSTQGQSPYGEYSPPSIEEGFFGLIKNSSPLEPYLPKNFPSLWDMYGKFIGDNDVEFLWKQIYEDVIHGPEIQNAISAHAEQLQAEIDASVMPSFVAGMRNINAVQSSAFIVGKALIADSKIRNINDFAGKIRLQAIQVSAELWKAHLQWSQSSISLYKDLFITYYTTKLDFDSKEFEYAAKDAQWDINTLDTLRAAIGTLNGAAAASGSASNEPSQAQAALAGALGGAAAGATFGPIGAGVGAVVGAGLSFL